MSNHAEVKSHNTNSLFALEKEISQLIRERREAELAMDAEILELEARVRLLEEDNLALATRAEDLAHEKRTSEEKIEEIRSNSIILNKERNYFEARMHQERELSRQLLAQNEALQNGSKTVPRVAAAEGDVGHCDPRPDRKPCVVCMEHRPQYESIPCDHPLCTDCFVHWYASLMNYNDTRHESESPAVFSCPLCRTPIDVQGSA